MKDLHITAGELRPEHLGHDIIVTIPDLGREGVYLTTITIKAAPGRRLDTRVVVAGPGRHEVFEVDPDAPVEVLGWDESTLSDRDAVDALATLLGTAPDWDGAADFLSDIATILSRTSRPSVDTDPDDFRREFLKATGRPVVNAFDGSL